MLFSWLEFFLFPDAQVILLPDDNGGALKCGRVRTRKGMSGYRVIHVEAFAIILKYQPLASDPQ